VKCLKNNFNSITSGLGRFGLGVHIRQSGDKKGPADQAKKLNGTR